MVDDQLGLQFLQEMTKKIKFKNVNDQQEKYLKLTEEDINDFTDFASLDLQDREAIVEFVYQLSLLLYKTNTNGKS